MELARRLYIYFITAISLIALAVGLINLLQLALDALWGSLGGTRLLQGDPDEVRRQLSLYAALTVVALPIWLLHWWLAQRSVHQPRLSRADQELASVRFLYLTIGLLVPFITWLIAGVTLVNRLVSDIFGQSSIAGDRRVPDALAVLLVALGIWAYHAWVELSDLRDDEPPPDVTLAPRLYLYIAAFVGAMLLLFGAADLISLVVEAVSRSGASVVETRWWVQPLASGIARVTLGLIAWGIHWSYALRGAEDAHGARERHSPLRRLYHYLVLLVVIFVALRDVEESLQQLLRWLLSAPIPTVAPSLARRLIEPLLVALPFALFWLYHRQRVLVEAREQGELPLQASARRLYTYLVALVGLIFAAVGVARVLTILIDLTLGQRGTISRSPDWWRGEVSLFGALAVIGTAAWLWQWYRAEGWLARAPAEERAATTRRTYLYLVVAASLVAILISLAIVIYRVLNIILDVSSSATFLSRIGGPGGPFIIAAALLAYHFVILRRDLAATPKRVEAVRLALVMSAPPGTDLEALLATLRSQLPEGVSLQASVRPG